MIFQSADREKKFNGKPESSTPVQLNLLVINSI
jgi:hypothetical protein